MDKNDTTEKESDRTIIDSYANETMHQTNEIDLVDLWISFWDRRLLFFSSAVLVMVFGIASFEIIYNPKQVASVRSLIEIQETSFENPAITAAYSAALARRIEIVDLPLLASEEEFTPVRPYLMSSSIEPVEGANFIEVVTDSHTNIVAEVAKFHNRMNAYIVSEAKISSQKFKSTIDDGWSSINNRIIRLRASVKELDRSLNLYADSHSPLDQQVQDSFGSRLEGLTAEIDALSEDLAALDSTLHGIRPRILVDARVSESTRGVKRSTVYLLILISAVFLAFLILAGSAFVSRVRDKLASRS